MSGVQLPAMWVIVFNVLGWLIIHGIASWWGHRQDVRHFYQDRFPYRLLHREHQGKVYERRLFIKKWKAWLPDGAAWFTGGFAKKRLQSADADYLQRFVWETRRAEWTHWLTMVPTPLFFWWNDFWGSVVIVGYAILANVPCILVQRYNRARLLHVLEQKKRKKQARSSG
jgi:glycosyl-4,4'-diaponeurosporenoate acyltransferase